MRKMVKLLEDKKVRDNNQLFGDTREIIRDVQVRICVKCILCIAY